MSAQRTRLRPLYIPQRKHADFESPPCLSGGSLSPDLQPNSPPVFPQQRDENDSNKAGSGVSKIGQYLLLEQVDNVGNLCIYKAINCDNQEEVVCKVIPVKGYRETLAAYWRVGSHSNINEIQEIILGETLAYVFFPRNHGDLHSHVRNKRKLREMEAVGLFRQIVEAVNHCHKNGVILRDLKLRKFVFKDADRTQIKLEGLEDARVLQDDTDDRLADKHGCPAYVSPEILNTNQNYSGRAADIWSLGVMLYTMLVGRYPFHDVEPTTLLTKIRRGEFSTPISVSTRARCLIRNVLRKDPAERLMADVMLQHPWFRTQPRATFVSKDTEKNKDQTVPSFTFSEDDDPFL